MGRHRGVARRDPGFQERGRRVVAYLADPADTRSYYLACAADEILATPLADLNVTGLRARVDFLKDALDNLGVEVEVVAVSPYKSAGERFVRNDFSGESREQAGRLLDRRFEEVVRAISDGRGLSREEVRAKIDLAPYGAREALSEGLLDGVLYEDELPARLGSEERSRQAGRVGPGAKGPCACLTGGGPRNKVALVSLSGAIVRGRSRRLPVPLPFVGGEQAGSESVVAALRVAEKSRRVSAVLFHVDSPGGDALASDLIWREVERTARRKPVVVLMGNAAASGGYYVSAAGEPRRRPPRHGNGFHRRVGHPPRRARPLREAGHQPRRARQGGACRPSRPEPPPGRRGDAGDRRPDRTHLRRVQGPRRAGARDDAFDLEGIAGGRVWTGDGGAGARVGRRDGWLQGGACARPGSLAA